jgi:hypothetical protein
MTCRAFRRLAEDSGVSSSLPVRRRSFPLLSESSGASPKIPSGSRNLLRAAGFFDETSFSSVRLRISPRAAEEITGSPSTSVDVRRLP